MSIEKEQHKTLRLSCRTDSGQRTTASMPESVKQKYVEAFGGPGKFRKRFNEALREAVPKPGLTRSMAVRLILDKRLGR